MQFRQILMASAQGGGKITSPPAFVSQSSVSNPSGGGSITLLSGVNLSAGSIAVVYFNQYANGVSFSLDVGTTSGWVLLTQSSGAIWASIGSGLAYKLNPTSSETLIIASNVSSASYAANILLFSNADSIGASGWGGAGGTNTKPQTPSLTFGASKVAVWVTALSEYTDSPGGASYGVDTAPTSYINYAAAIPSTPGVYAQTATRTLAATTTEAPGLWGNSGGGVQTNYWNGITFAVWHS